MRLRVARRQIASTCTGSGWIGSVPACGDSAL